jgi:hypothetical protein
MPQLTFLARKDHLVNAIPGHWPGVGQHMRYVNREYDPKTRQHPAQRSPFTVDADSADGKELLRRMRKSPKDPPMWPGDQVTASACGIPLAEIELIDGEWVPKRKTYKAATHSERRKGSTE